MLWWIGRFRFVTAAELSLRFGISEQRINARVRRFLREDLVAVHREHVSQSRAIYLTARGASVIEQPRRRPPRAGHAAPARARGRCGSPRSSSSTRRRPGARVLTERECRQAERAGDRAVERRRLRERPRSASAGPTSSSTSATAARPSSSSSPSSTPPGCERIIESYEIDGTFEEVLWLVEQPALRRRIETLTAQASTARLSRVGPSTRQRAERWAPT